MNNLNQNDFEKIIDKNILIIGCGGKTHEVIRILISICNTL